MSVKDDHTFKYEWYKENSDVSSSGEIGLIEQTQQNQTYKDPD